jgi:cytochrome c biogenesis protein CcdA
VIEYEIHQNPENAQVFDWYVENYHAQLGFPLLIFGENTYLFGKREIIVEAPKYFARSGDIPAYGDLPGIDEIDLASLEGSPKIWHQDRILLKTGPGGDTALLKRLLTEEDIAGVLDGSHYEIIYPEPVAVSGNAIIFSHAVRTGSWVLQYDKSPPLAGCTTDVNPDEVIPGPTSFGSLHHTPTLAKVASLALADAINPCALAVLTLMLLSVLTSCPEDRKRILWAGFAFISAIFVFYLLYGLIIIQSFQLVGILVQVRPVIYQAVAVGAIALGILNIRDFLGHRTRGPFMEMPVSFRPKVRDLVTGVTSPPGAFLAGMLVSAFLLPCTIGPYIIAGGLLSVFDLLSTIPYLILYNLIFVVPMVAITILVYAGMAGTDDVSGWRERNVRYIRLISGVIILTIGVMMILGMV